MSLDVGAFTGSRGSITRVTRSYRHAANYLIVCQEPRQAQSLDSKASRRGFILRSCTWAVLADAALNQSDPKTIVNSLLGKTLEHEPVHQLSEKLG